MCCFHEGCCFVIHIFWYIVVGCWDINSIIVGVWYVVCVCANGGVSICTVVKEFRFSGMEKVVNPVRRVVKGIYLQVWVIALGIETRELSKGVILEVCR